MRSESSHPPRLVSIAVITACVLFGGSCDHGPTSLLPANYRSTFTVTRSCRSTSEHIVPVPGSDAGDLGITNIIVYVSPEAASGYDAHQNPLPAGALVIKEEHDDTNCNHVVAWSIAHKEPGFDPAHGDWHWQHVLADGRIDADGSPTACTNNSCHGVPTCVARDWMCTAP